MCLAIPSEIVEIRNQVATIAISGVRRRVSLLLLPEEAAVGDYVLVHAGFAIHKMDAGAGRDALELFHKLTKEEETEPEIQSVRPAA